MGRKPNPVISEYYERGEKIDDKSNRYHHTCKSCGEQFPRGRIDSLNIHLLQKCPAIPFDERQQVIQRMSEIPNQRGIPNPLATAMKIYGTEVPAPLRQVSSSALETLAEVSRQRLGPGETQTADTSTTKKRKRAPGTNDVEQTEGVVEASHSRPGTAEGPSSNRDDAAAPVAASVEANGNDRLLKSIQQAAGKAAGEDVEHTSLEEETDDVQHTAPVANMGSTRNIAIAASAASDMMHDGSTPPRHGTTAVKAERQGTEAEATAQRHQRLLSTIDPQLRNTLDALFAGGPNAITDESPGRPIQHVKPHVRAKPMQYDTASISLAPLAEQPHARYLNNFSISPNASRPRVRGRFAEGRRKEVQEIRRQGACLRCRMLKKPCSAGMPCATCRSVESARLWKQPCVRAKLADEFDIYSAGAHVVSAFQKLNDLRSQKLLQSTSRIAHATHFADADTPSTEFPIVSVKSPIPSASSGQPVDAQDASHQDVHDEVDTAKPEMLDVDFSGGAKRLDQYFKSIGHTLFEREPSQVMRSTLLIAEDLAHQRYDTLLSRCLDLWIATQVLVDPEMPWRLSYHEKPAEKSPDQLNTSPPPDKVEQQLLEEVAAASLEAPQQPPTSNKSTTPTRSPAIPTTPSPPQSQNVQILQLLAAAEKSASSHSKIIVSELERRLINRHQAVGQQFETLLSAVILLNSIERICWLFNTWPHTIEASHSRLGAATARSKASSDSHDNNTGGATAVVDRGAWPLPTHPTVLLQHAERVAEVVTMLVRFRGIDLAGRFDDSGVLGVLGIVSDVPEAMLVASAHGDVEAKLAEMLVSHNNAQEHGQNVRAPENVQENDKTAEAVWLESVQITKQQLEVARVSGTEWDLRGQAEMERIGCRAWDLKYIADLLWPEGEAPSDGWSRDGQVQHGDTGGEGAGGVEALEAMGHAGGEDAGMEDVEVDSVLGAD
ncbi:MAG: hypothetical protein M1828_002744 [Chrysothrix sp. TS-e1954]|nr:MAG: hypothetical protein M1828_002744 [Chrysothrix sp. TS-e1954]